MRIVWVKANKLLPLHSGGDIRSYHIARYLAGQHELVFLSYYDGEPDHEYDKKLHELFPGSVSIATGRPDSSRLARIFDYVAHLASPLPYAVGRFRSPAVERKLGDWFAEREFDVAVCDFLDAAVNFPHQLSIPSVLFQHNVESEIWRRHSSTQPNPFKRRLYAVEFRKMLRYERAAVGRFQHVIAVSEHDRHLMQAWVEGSRITVVPTGVDLDEYRPAATPARRLLVMFVGAMDWEPNIDASEYLCREIWPLVLAEVPEAKLRIVGRNPAERVCRLAAPSVEVTGRVPAVIEELREAAVVVVPIRIGGGTRLKIYEAMAAGKAVVSTTVGAEGLEVNDGRDIILADTRESFARAVCSLLKDENLRQRYERAAVEHTLRFDWRVISQKFEQVLETVSGYSGSPEKVQATIGAG
ncbi:MAG: glycosyltransferase [Acidobacteria bacterium]|nr:glycosyltransferase [Acidobacteriota bacterium]MBV9626133.1 glycosyltransferase [Acidobacteriota bacterium]